MEKQPEKMNGRERYEYDCKVTPQYFDGTPRETWEQLPQFIRNQWSQV